MATRTGSDGLYAEPVSPHTEAWERAIGLGVERLDGLAEYIDGAHSRCIGY